MHLINYIVAITLQFMCRSVVLRRKLEIPLCMWPMLETYVSIAKAILTAVLDGTLHSMALNVPAQ